MIIALLTQVYFVSANESLRQQTLVEHASELEKESALQVSLKNYSTAKVLLKKALQLSLPDTLIASVLKQYSKILVEEQKFDESLDYAHRALQLYKKHLAIGDKKRLDLLYHIGDIHSGMSNQDSLSFYWEKCDSLFRIYDKKNYRQRGLINNNLGTNYLSRGFSQKAGYHFREAVINWEMVAEEHPRLLAIGYENLGAYLDTELGIAYLQKALSIKKSLGENPFRSYIEIAAQQSILENYDQALFYYHQGISLLKPLAEAQKKGDFNYQYDLAAGYSQLAQTHEAKAQYDSAHNYFEKALEVPTVQDNWNYETQLRIRKANVLYTEGKYKEAIAALKVQLSEASREGNYLFGYATYSLAKTYASLGQYEDALKHNLYSLRYEENQSKNTKTANAAIVFSRNRLAARPNACVLLSRQSLYLLELSRQATDDQEKLLHLALASAKEALAHFEETAGSAEVSPFFKNNYNKAFGTYQSILYDLHKLSQDNSYVEEAFLIAEKAKINNTLLQFNSLEIRQAASFPEKIYEREKGLKAQISETRKVIYNESQLVTTVDSVKLLAAYDSLFEQNRRYEDFKADIAAQYPKYVEQKYNQAPLALTDLMANLEAGTVAIAYAFHEEEVFIYAVSNTQSEMVRLIGAEPIRELITKYRNALADPSVRPEEFLSLAYPLYHKLLFPIWSVIKDADNLLILPDKELSTVPFETLVTRNQAEKGYSGMPFLYRQQDIHYAYSATLWLKQKEKEITLDRKLWGGFAPEYNEGVLTENGVREVLFGKEQVAVSQLTGALEEVRALSQLMSGKEYIGIDANKTAFLKDAQDFKILHLAAHTIINDDVPMYSRFLFTEDVYNDAEQLSVFELYQLNLNADLVVLSACNTGYGRLLPGEGVQSLSSAFTAAGCPATLMSLWMVPDKETATLMTDFYKGLNSGLAKNKALSLAKTNYLSQVSNDQMAHPFYWGGFILSGNSQPIIEDTHSQLRGVLLLFALVVIVVSVIVMRKMSLT